MTVSYLLFSSQALNISFSFSLSAVNWLLFSLGKIEATRRELCRFSPSIPFVPCPAVASSYFSFYPSSEMTHPSKANSFACALNPIPPTYSRTLLQQVSPTPNYHSNGAFPSHKHAIAFHILKHNKAV